MPLRTAPVTRARTESFFMSIRGSVVIPHFNDLDNLRTCLALLANQSYPRDSYEIVVADNNSAVGIEAVRAAAGPTVIVVPAPEQGAAAARNAGAAAARAEILAFIDSDCRPSPDWLAEGLAAMAAADVVGGCVRVVAEIEGQLQPVEAFEAVFAFNNEAYIKKKSFSVTANLFVRRSVFDEVGGFRAGVSEDVEWCLRAAAAGYPVRYAPRVIVDHPARRSWSELVTKWRRLTREAYLLMRERRLGRLKWLLRCWAVLLSSFFDMFTVLSSRKLRGIGNRLRVVSILFRIRFYRFIESHRVAWKMR